MLLFRDFEAFENPDGTVTINKIDTGESFILKMCTPFVREAADNFKTFRTEAWERTGLVYKASEKRDPAYYEFLRVRRIIKCNLGAYDNVPDVDDEGNMHKEFVPCPLRGECPEEDVICNAKFNSTLTKCELAVMRLLYEGNTAYETSKLLFISENTVKKHRSNSLTKLRIDKMVDFVRLAESTNLFKL